MLKLTIVSQIPGNEQKAIINYLVFNFIKSVSNHITLASATPKVIIKGSGVLSTDKYFHNYYKPGYESGYTGKLLD